MKIFTKLVPFFTKIFNNKQCNVRFINNRTTFLIEYLIIYLSKAKNRIKTHSQNFDPHTPRHAQKLTVLHICARVKNLPHGSPRGLSLFKNNPGEFVAFE